MMYVFSCLICGGKFEVGQGMSDEHKAFHCGIEAQRVFTPFYTDRDLAWNFTSHSFGRRPTVIHSRRQYNRKCKENGLVSTSPSELRSIKPNKEAKSIYRDKARNVAIKMKKEGVAEHLPSFIKKFSVKEKNGRRN